MKNKFLKNLFCIIVIFTVILSILVIPASAADDSSDTMIIKAGTYRFNDSLNLPSSNISSGIIAFTCSPPIDNILYYNGINVRTDSVNINYVTTDGSSSTWIYLNSNWDTSKCSKTLIFSADTEVDDTFGTWFTENTQMLIEAGTYRFNDDITLYGSGTSKIYIDFTVAGVYLGYSFTANCSYFYTDTENNIFKYWADSTYPVYPDYPNGVYLTVYGDGWLSDFDENVRFVNILTDTYVPTNFGLWANENWQKLSDVEEPDTCPTLEDYLADFNDTYIDGILYTEGEAFMDYLLDADIDLHTSIYDYVVGNLIIDELRLLNPSLYNELYDLGYAAGEIAGEASGYDEGLIVGREEGWQNGYNAGSSSSLGENLIVDLFDAPIQVIDNIVLYENTVAGVTFTVSLWNVLTSVIIICILTWILKLISGG